MSPVRCHGPVRASAVALRVLIVAGADERAADDDLAAVSVGEELSGHDP